MFFLCFEFQHKILPYDVHVVTISKFLCIFEPKFEYLATESSVCIKD